MVEQGVASAADIDTAMKLGYGHPMGPLELTDLVGLDVRLGIAEYLETAIGPAFTPPKILRDKVAAGKLGKKTGEGFYSSLFFLLLITCAPPWGPPPAPPHPSARSLPLTAQRYQITGGSADFNLRFPQPFSTGGNNTKNSCPEADSSVRQAGIYRLS